MIEKYQQLFLITYEKFENCFCIIEKSLSISLTYPYKGWFDYDPINNESFIETLLPLLNNDIIHIFYIDVDQCLMQKHLIYEYKDFTDSSSLDDLRLNHALLYDCEVEGSYYITTDNGKWIAFYDAQSDTGILMSSDNVIIMNMEEYIIQ